MKGKVRSQLLGYGVAVVSVVVATALRYAVGPLLPPGLPFLTYFIAVVVSAWYGGLGPAAVCIVLSSLAAAHFFIPPDDSLLIEDPAHLIGLGAFIVLGAAMAALGETMRVAVHHAQLAAEEVRAQAERFRVTLNSIGDGVIVTDSEARILFLNPAAEQLTGWTRAEAEGQPLEVVFPIVHEQTRQAADNPVRCALRAGQVVTLADHTLLIARNGIERAIDHSAAPIYQENGQIAGAVLVFRDVSLKRHADLARGRLAALVDSSEDAILGQSLDGIVTDWNPGAERLFGYSAAEVVGKPIFQSIVPPERKDELLGMLQRVARGERVEHFESVRRRKNGTLFPVSIRISPIRSADGRVIGASAIDRDISQLQSMEKRRTARLAVTQILAEEATVARATARLLETICRALEWDAGCLWLRDEARTTLVCQEFWREPTGRLEEFERASRGQRFGPGDGLPGRVWHSGRPFWIADVVQDPNFRRAPQARTVGIHGAFACPIRSGTEVVGVIEFFSHEIKSPDDDFLEMMSTIAGQLGQFLEHRHAEELVRRSEKELADFFESAVVALHWVGPDGTILRVNQAELDMLGYERDEYLGHNIREFHADPEVIEEILRRLQAGERLKDYPARLRRKDGTLRHVLIDSSVYWENGRFVHTRCFTRDVTEQKLAESARLESEERLRLALAAGRMGAWQWDVASGKVIWSPTLEAIHGLAPGTFPGTFEAYRQGLHPDDRDRVQETLRAALEEDKEYHLEYRIIWPDQSVHWLETRGQVFRDQARRPVRMVGVCADVTQRRQLEDELRRRMHEAAEAEERIRSVVDHALDGIITIDAEGLIQTFNPAAERLFGYSASQVIGQNVKLLMPEPYRSEHDAYILRYLQTGEARIIGSGRQVVGRRRDGTTFPMELAVSEFHVAGGRFFTGIVRDVTERQRREGTLRFLAEASKSLSLLVDYKSTLQRVVYLAVPGFADWCALDMVDAEGRLEQVALAHSDRQKAQLAQELARRYPPVPDAPFGPYHVLHTGRPQMLAEIDDNHLAHAARDEEHARILRELGPRSCVCVPIVVQGTTLGVLTFLYAESGRRYGPEDLSLAEDLAHRAAIAIENARLYQQVREADRRKDEFLAMLAHELRNPLAPIRHGLELLALEDHAHRDNIQFMQRQVEHLVRLVDDLLDVSRIVRGKIELRKEILALAAVVQQAVDTVRPLAEAHTLVVSLPEEPVWVEADPVRLAQIIENLLSNACKYTDKGGRIEVSVCRGAEDVAVTVKDNGIGIDRDLLPRVFDLFTQSSRTLDRSQGGLGIGLTLVRTLVEMHGGSVSAASEGPGRGSQFTVRLPLARKTSIPESPAAPPAPASGRRVLVVDDNVGAARMLALLVSRLGPHEIEIAHDGLSTIEKVHGFLPDIVLLDIGLPGMDGYEVARRLRASEQFKKTRLIALTGYGQDDDRRRSREAGFDEHVVKPVEVETLLRLLQ